MGSNAPKKFTLLPGSARNSDWYTILFESVEEVYVTDAYHSLSIEKYKAPTELIERVRMGTWNTKGNDADRQQRDAMAAKGYYDAFKAVEKSIDRILQGEMQAKWLTRIKKFDTANLLARVLPQAT